MWHVTYSNYISERSIVHSFLVEFSLNVRGAFRSQRGTLENWDKSFGEFVRAMYLVRFPFEETNVWRNIQNNTSVIAKEMKRRELDVSWHNCQTKQYNSS